MSVFIIAIALITAGSTNAIAIEEEELFNPVVEVKDGTVLNVIDCVSLAFKNSPKIRRHKYELDIAKSNLGIAKSVYFPTLGAGVGFGYERNSDSIYYDKRYELF